MSDQRLRELERRYRESGLAADEADYLGEAVRVGRYQERRVQILADVGYVPARLLEGREEITPEELAALGRLVRERWGQWELATLNYALVLRLLPPPEAFANATRLALDPALEAMAAWLRRSESEPRRALSQAARALSPTELTAWLGEPSAEALRGAFATIVWGPTRGLMRHPSFEVPRLAAEVLGLPGYLEAIKVNLAPRLLQEPD